jgi:hypothetical protein
MNILKRIGFKVLPKRRLQLIDLNRIKPVSPIFGIERGTPIDRYYIEKFLSSNKDIIRGNLLEIAENHYCRKFNNGDVLSFEVLHVDSTNKNATIIGDLTIPDTLPEKKIDCFICTQTLNFIYDFEKAIEGTYKLLNKGGYLLGTVSGISQVSEYDMDRWGDYWRFTHLSIQRVFEKIYGKGNVNVTVYGNVLATIAFLQGIVVEDLPNSALLDKTDNRYQVTIGIKAQKT